MKKTDKKPVTIPKSKKKNPPSKNPIVDLTSTEVLRIRDIAKSDVLKHIEGVIRFELASKNIHFETGKYNISTLDIECLTLLLDSYKKQCDNIDMNLSLVFNVALIPKWMKRILKMMFGCKL